MHYDKVFLQYYLNSHNCSHPLSSFFLLIFDALCEQENSFIEKPAISQPSIYTQSIFHNHPKPSTLLSPSHFLLFTVLTVCRLLTFRLVFFVFISPPFFLPSPIPPPVFLQLLTWIGSPAVHALWSNQSVHSPFLHIKTWRPPFPLSICLHSFRFPQSLSVDPSSHLDSEFSAAFLFLSSLI